MAGAGKEGWDVFIGARLWTDFPAKHGLAQTNVPDCQVAIVLPVSPLPAN